MKKYQKNTKGITLIALVITIIILIILSGITISQLSGSGLFGRAQQAEERTEMANIKEQIQLEIYNKQLLNTGSISDQELNSILEKYGTIKYEADGKTIKGITTKNGYEILLPDINSIQTTEEKIVADGSWQKGKGVNSPQLLTGMTPIKFTDPTDSTEGTTVKMDKNNLDGTWYSYVSQKWANAQTQDGSMWVWIPRFAYRINSSTQTCDIVFLINDTDNYYDENGNLQKAKKQETQNGTIDTTTGYTVHPAFTNESSINYANGGWNKNLAGIWVAKFEAGYATGNNTVTKADGTAYTKDEILANPSSVYYTENGAWSPSSEVKARNWLDGEYGTTRTYIKYPTFQGLTYSMNYIGQHDAYNISKALTENNNIYGLNSSNADSHLIKNSEWGAVAYLSQSKYGLNGERIYKNNADLNGTTTDVYAVTGCSAKTKPDEGAVTTTIEAINDRTANVYTWTQKNGQKASSSGTIYGIYDISGGLWEKTAGLVANGNYNVARFGKALIDEVTKNNADGTKTYESSPYVTIYPSNDSGISNSDTASVENYKVNTKIYGDAIRETSSAGVGRSSWYSDFSYFVGAGDPFFQRGGALQSWMVAGLFTFYHNYGGSYCYTGFRPVLVGV